MKESDAAPLPFERALSADPRLCNDVTRVQQSSTLIGELVFWGKEADSWEHVRENANYVVMVNRNILI
jgi:hypothetical protein